MRARYSRSGPNEISRDGAEGALRSYSTELESVTDCGANTDDGRVSGA